MPQSPSPNSPAMEHTHQVDRQQSNSPPLAQIQHQSKREKRRTHLTNRLEEITKTFVENRDDNYRSQLQSVQVDMTLIMEADPYASHPLVDDRQEISRLVSEHMLKLTNMKAMSSHPPLRAGSLYAQFAKEINDAMEERDTNLTRHMMEFESKKTNISTSQTYRRRLAENEHKALATTVRDRLINSVTSKKARLHKDKDILEISEGNALLLHPSQFSISNPGSPGGLHGKRATRNRREPEDLLNSSETQRRKRKAHDSDESPAPKRLPSSKEWAEQWITNGDRGSVRHGQENKEALMAMQFDSPLFSVDKLFTEKELAMIYHNAAMAAQAYMARQPNGSDELDSPPNGPSESSAENGRADGPEDVPSPPPGMERQPSHATRSTRAPFSSNYLNIDLVTGKGGLYTPSDIQQIVRSAPKMPPLLNLMGSRPYNRNDPVQSLHGLSEADINTELEFISRARRYNDEHGLGRNLDVDQGARELLQHAALPNGANEHWVRASKKSSNPNAGMSSVRDDLAEGSGSGLGGVEMGRENSFGGGSMGGTAMSRQATDQSTRDRIKRDTAPRRKNGL